MRRLLDTLRRLDRRYVAWSEAAHGMGQLVLGRDEVVRLKTLGSLNPGLLPSQGRVILTNQRLIYVPSQLKVITSWPFDASLVSIPLGDLVAVRQDHPWARWGGFPGLSRLIIELRDGKKLILQTIPANYVKEQIESAMREAG